MGLSKTPLSSDQKGSRISIYTAGEARRPPRSFFASAMTFSSVDPLVLEAVEAVCSSEIPKYQNDTFYNSVPRPLFQSLCAAGLGGLSVPEELGGVGASAATTAAVFEAIARHDLGPAIFISVHAMVCSLINRHGSEEQRATILPTLASGASLAAFALTEPGAGSDAAALTTTATPRDGGFTLRGEKCYITSAGFADLYLVFARSDSSTKSEISAFLVPSSAPGLSISKPERKMGCELSPIASLRFDELFVESSALLGPLHEGFKVALSGLASGRVNIAACANGLSRAALDCAQKHLTERKQFGKQLAEFQGLQFMLADMYSSLQAARLLTQQAATDIDSERAGGNSGTNSRLSSSVAKCFATDAAMQITTNAVQLLGGAGYIKEYHVERYMRDAKMLQIVEGTNQIQRMIIARELLK